MGASSEFYYLDSAGNLMSRDGTQGSKPAKVGHAGRGFSQIAVSPDGRYVAALRAGSLFIGPVNGKLSKRDGAGYTTMSWDPADNVWATTGDQIVMLRGAANPAQALGQPVDVSVVNSDGSSPVVGPYTSLRVAPDGVRVAIIVGETELNFGAIVWQQGARAAAGDDQDRALAVLRHSARRHHVQLGDLVRSEQRDHPRRPRQLRALPDRVSGQRQQFYLHPGAAAHPVDHDQ